MKQYMAIIANPNAGTSSRRKVRQAVDLLERGGREVRLYHTRCQGDATGLAAEAAAGGRASVVIAAGGDGTVNEVANGLAGTGVPMAIVPMGTSNVFAKEVSIPENVRGAVSTVLRNEVHTIRLGKIEWEGRSRLFCLMAGLGFDGLAVYRTRHSKLMGVSRKLAHVVSGFGVLSNWSPPELRIKADGRQYEAASLIVCNAAKYAGHFKVAPDASVRDEGLYVFAMQGRRRLDILRYVLGVLAGRNVGMKGSAYFKAHSIEVEGSARIQADGDYLGLSPALITSGAADLLLLY